MVWARATPLRAASEKSFNSSARFIRFHHREVVIALILAIVCAVAVDRYFRHAEQSRHDEAVREITNATATLIVYDKQGQPDVLGVGIFITPDGRLITNRHVIKTGRIEAKLRSGAFYKLKNVIGDYEEYDLSILQFEGQGISYANLGDSDLVRVGQPILALVAQSSSGTTLTSGIVSNPKRTISSTIRELIEIAAPISSHVTNGGLFDTDGHVLGFISNEIIPPQLRQSLSGIFAIPINRLRAAINGNEKKSTTESPEYFYLQGVAAENNKQFDKAFEYYKKAVSLNPRYAYAYFGLGGIYYEQGDYDKQLEMYRKAAEYAPKDFDILFYLATAFEDKGLYSDAIAAYQRVLQIKPDHKDSMYQLGILYMMRGEKAKAIAIITALERLDPGSGGELKMLLTRMKW